MTIKVVVPISGGKDSQACLKLALANYHPSEVRGLFCDTQFEHPDTYAHVKSMETLYGPVQIDRVCAGSVLEKTRKYQRFPGGGARHCTDELKMRPTRDYLVALAKEQGEGFEVWFGMRSGESTDRRARYAGKVSDEVYPAHEVLPKKYPKYLHTKMGVTFRLAILEWTTEDVFDYLDGQANPLYAVGFDRVGCFPCLAGGDAAKRRAFAFDDFGRQQYAQVIVVSKEIGKSIWTSKGMLAQEQTYTPCGLFCENNTKEQQ